MWVSLPTNMRMGGFVAFVALCLVIGAIKGPGHKDTTPVPTTQTVTHHVTTPPTSKPTPSPQAERREAERRGFDSVKQMHHADGVTR